MSHQCQVCGRPALYVATYPPITLSSSSIGTVTAGSFTLDVCLTHARNAQRPGGAKLKLLLP